MNRNLLLAAAYAFTLGGLVGFLRKSILAARRRAAVKQTTAEITLPIRKREEKPEAPAQATSDVLPRSTGRPMRGLADYIGH